MNKKGQRKDEYLTYVPNARRGFSQTVLDCLIQGFQQIILINYIVFNIFLKSLSVIDFKIMSKVSNVF